MWCFTFKDIVKLLFSKHQFSSNIIWEFWARTYSSNQKLGSLASFHSLHRKPNDSLSRSKFLLQMRFSFLLCTYQRWMLISLIIPFLLSKFIVFAVIYFHACLVCCMLHFWFAKFSPLNQAFFTCSCTQNVQLWQNLCSSKKNSAAKSLLCRRACKKVSFSVKMVQIKYSYKRCMYMLHKTFDTLLIYSSYSNKRNSYFKNYWKHCRLLLEEFHCKLRFLNHSLSGYWISICFGLSEVCFAAYIFKSPLYLPTTIATNCFFNLAKATHTHGIQHNAGITKAHF